MAGVARSSSWLQGAGQTVNGPLGGDVGRHCRRGNFPEDGADQHQVPGTLALELTQGCPGDVRGAAEVGSHRGIEDLVRQVDEASVGEGASAVYDGVDPAEARNGGGHEVVDGGCVADVGGDGQHVRFSCTLRPALVDNCRKGARGS